MSKTYLEKTFEKDDPEHQVQESENQTTIIFINFFNFLFKGPGLNAPFHPYQDDMRRNAFFSDYFARSHSKILRNN